MRKSAGRVAEVAPAGGSAGSQRTAGTPYVEFLRRETLSVGFYLLPAGAADDQAPHTEDEIYVVLGGRSRFTSGTETRAVEPGDTIFVPAGEEHRFHDIVEELRLVVVFAPPEGGSAV